MVPDFLELGIKAADWWSLASAIIGGVIGSFAGGIPAWLLARRASREASKNERERQAELDQTAWFRIFVKLSTIANGLLSTLIQIDEMLTTSLVDEHDEAPTQRRVLAFAGLNSRDAVTFHADELQVLMKADEADYLSDLELLAQRHLAILLALEEYGRRKAKLHDFLTSVEGTSFGPKDTMSTHLIGANAIRARAEARALESIIAPAVEFLRRDSKFAIKLGEQFGPKMKKFFPTKKVPSFQFDRLQELSPGMMPLPEDPADTD